MSHELQFIQDILKQIQHKLYHNSLYVPSYLVGIDSLVTHINLWIQENGSNKNGIATICGIGGIGKTAIAKVVFNQNIQRFEGYSFLADVRETTQECNGLVRLQRQVISDILKGKANKIYNADNGILKIKEAVCCRRVLIVLDDVDDLENITKIFGKQIPFFPGTLQVLGSSLSGKSISVWKNALEKLEAIPDSKIQKILRVSYDSLQDDHDKNLFLDIACLFIGKDRDYTTAIQDGCGFYTIDGIENLIGRAPTDSKASNIQSTHWDVCVIVSTGARDFKWTMSDVLEKMYYFGM
ncbi:putative disease resistance protein At4g11170 [Durio zibethinus]|uniref:Disease resistance protein At4g11170 n=1 Tax=Durio zibethinus TaxID=66656 RepID=A0A6P5YU88_DURZI|nr:putative disease resistance protein At4g11170 [Durio zibethinus]